MLLGIVLHAALSFAPIPWTVQDTQQSGFYYVLFACIHGFRMPLFFMLSGFFTAMLWRKRGLASLVKQRCLRILLPLVIGCLTIVPAMWVVSYVVTRPSAQSPAQSSTEEIVWQAVVDGDTERVQSAIRNSEIGVNALNANSGASLLTSAVFMGHDELVQMLIDEGADVNQQNHDQATPLHSAAFMGRADAASMLIQAGANPDARDGASQTPKDLLKIDFGTTSFLAGQYGVQVEEEALRAGRAAIAREFGVTEYLGADAASDQSAALQGLMNLFFYIPAFMHLWFLWFLCWLVVAFLAYTLIAKALPIDRLPRWLVCSPISLLWLIPLTMLAQLFMEPGGFGPDASVGLLPIPGVLAYYAIFFFFGAVYWDMDDSDGQLGRWWYISLPVALLIVFPIGLDLVSGTFGLIPKLEDPSTNILAAKFLQATFAWLMTFGSIGLCRRLLSRESKTMRYISDSSYWLYLIHLPLVLLAQWLVRDLQIPALLKFAGITIVISAFLLLTYEYGVRYTPIGKLLNGPRKRPA